MYIAATGQVVSTVLTVEREEQGKAYKVQRPVYYISEVLTPSKQRYPHYQKLVYGIYLTAKKVAHYFQEHTVSVVSDAPLSEIMNNRDATGRVAKWAIELLPLDIKFEAKKAIKSKALADFLAEWTEQQQPTQSHRKPSCAGRRVKWPYATRTGVFHIQLHCWRNQSESAGHN